MASPLLEDAAQAAGAEYGGVPVGTFGKSAMFSFTPTKNITTGEGGIVLTDDAQAAERLRLLRNHGQQQLYQHETGRLQLAIDGDAGRHRPGAAAQAGYHPCPQAGECRLDEPSAGHAARGHPALPGAGGQAHPHAVHLPG